MNILYLLNFIPSQSSGKYLGSYYKILAMRKVFGSVEVVCPYGNSLITKILSFLFNELYIVVASRKKDYIISRGISGILLSFVRPEKIVREIHAVMDDELELLGRDSLILRIASYLNRVLDRRCLIHIYNNPRLEAYYRDVQGFRGRALVSYNGADLEQLNLNDAAKFSLPIEQGSKFVVFTGSCSVWHDMSLVVKLASGLAGFGIKTIVAGGKFSSPNIYNVSPCDSALSAEYIKHSLGGLIFISDVRVSPGNALKLYEYMAAGKPVIADAGLEGYSDELSDYEGTFLIDKDFSDFERLAKFLLDNEGRKFLRGRPFTWESRIQGWYDFLKKAG